MTDRRYHGPCPFRHTLAVLDARQERLTGRTLAAVPLTWQQRAHEVTSRVHAAVAHLDELPDLELLAVAGAHLLALHDAAEQAATIRIETGEAA